MLRVTLDHFVMGPELRLEPGRTYDVEDALGFAILSQGTGKPANDETRAAFAKFQAANLAETAEADATDAETATLARRGRRRTEPEA